MPLERGNLIPHFAVSTADGGRFDYRDTWQRRNLLLITLPTTPVSQSEQQILSEITRHEDSFLAFDTICVVTADPIRGVGAPAVIIADRWGEVYLAARGASLAELPNADAILECLRYVAHVCPECEGESR
jgi:hypothetical protein